MLTSQNVSGRIKSNMCVLLNMGERIDYFRQFQFISEKIVFFLPSFKWKGNFGHACTSVQYESETKVVKSSCCPALGCVLQFPNVTWSLRAAYSSVISPRSV